VSVREFCQQKSLAESSGFMRGEKNGTRVMRNGVRRAGVPGGFTLRFAPDTPPETIAWLLVGQRHFAQPFNRKPGTHVSGSGLRVLQRNRSVGCFDADAHADGVAVKRLSPNRSPKVALSN